jgi:hypothetical protein
MNREIAGLRMQNWSPRLAGVASQTGIAFVLTQG